MKVILYMATTINGIIAEENDSTNFISEKELSNFSSMIKKIGNIIIGQKTYKIMKQHGEFKSFPEITTVIVSQNKVKINSPKHLTANSPKEALAILKKLGFNQALVAGGGILNASFLKKQLINEIYLDLEPVILGKGVKLFSENNTETKLELVEINQFSQNEIQLHYKVIN